jgi:hypothetical protein
MADREDRTKRDLLALIPERLTLKLGDLCDVGADVIIDGVIKETIDLAAFARHGIECDKCQIALFESLTELIEAIRPQIPKLLMLMATKGGMFGE